MACEYCQNKKTLINSTKSSYGTDTENCLIIDNGYLVNTFCYINHKGKEDGRVNTVEISYCPKCGENLAKDVEYERD